MLKNSSQNNGVAVIRIEDNRNGMEGYTGDIFWNGGNNDGGNWNGGWNGGGGGGNNNDWGIGNNNNWSKTTSCRTARTPFAARFSRTRVGPQSISTARRGSTRQDRS